MFVTISKLTHMENRAAEWRQFYGFRIHFKIFRESHKHRAHTRIKTHTHRNETACSSSTKSPDQCLAYKMTQAIKQVHAVARRVFGIHGKNTPEVR